LPLDGDMLVWEPRRHSVRLIKILMIEPAARPTFRAQVPSRQEMRETLKFSGTAADEGVTGLLLITGTSAMD